MTPQNYSHGFPSCPPWLPLGVIETPMQIRPKASGETSACVFVFRERGWSGEPGDSQEEMSFGYQECVWDPEQIFVFPLMPSWSSH